MLLHWLLQHCQSTGFNESFSYRVIDCDLIIEPLVEMIGGVWREQNEAFCGLADAHTSNVAPGICNLPSGAQCHSNAQIPHGYVCEDVRTTDFLPFFYSFLLTSTCVEWVVSTCPSSNPRPVFHALIIWSLSFCSFIFCSFLTLYHHFGLFRFLF